MRGQLCAVTVLAVAGAVAAPRSAPEAGRSLPSAAEPPAGFTGGFGEPTCTHCHIGNEVNAFGGSVRLEGLPGGYVAGEEYVLTVRLEADETDVAGFQLTARFADGPAAGGNGGALRPVDGRTTTKDSLGVTYVHQSPEGTRPADRSGSAWAVLWTAPDASAPVALHLAANSGNADNSPLGDLVYVRETVIRGSRQAPPLAAPSGL
jgi:hypothetical protein